MNDIKRRLRKQFMFDSEKYIAEHGLVTDKEKAIELLCESSKAWAVLDESLKADSEVIMYLQPMGERRIFLKNANDGSKSSFICSEEGFTCYDIDDRSLNNVDWFRLYLNSSSKFKYYFVPNINISRNFDFKKYFMIQSMLRASTNKDYNAAEMFSEAQGMIDYNSDIIGEEVTIYDRSKLASIVAEVCLKPKTKGIYPTMKSKTTSEN